MRRPVLLLPLATALLAAASAAADTVSFSAQLASEAEGAARGNAALSLDTASHNLQWRIEYSGLSRSPHGVGCGALDAPTGPAIWLTGNLASPVIGAKQLTQPQIAALAAGRWVCVVNGDEIDIGGVVAPAR